ncbi:MAG: DUF624 domain-containing protein [Microbacterium sp.]|uniref:ferredoxin-NADPH reductase n=1 Tax=Microbacterium sp. TaxID=51671 RepID=UPI001AD4FBB1|nr:ferredoxin-NADPH reductase [Microbacterium sp.]MBN9178176.1 DUF624 domain-containing protein [Microbacterium sp.]
MRFDKIQGALDTLGTAVAVNVLLAVTAAPLIAVVVFTDAFALWPLVAVTAVLAAPGLTAAFTVFAAPHDGVFRTFWRGYRATWRRASAVAGVAALVGVVLVVDVRFFADTPFAQAAMVVLVVTGLLVAGTALLALAAIAEAPGTSARDAVRRGAWFGVRRWYLTALSLVVLVVYAAAFVALPLLALSALASPALYLAWTNSRFTLHPADHLAHVRA